MVELVVNYIAVVAAAIASFVVGMIWHSPMGFGNMWMKLSGISAKDAEKGKAKMQKEMPKMFAAAFISALVLAYVMTYFIQLTGMSGLMGGLQVGFWAWLGF